MILYIKHLLRCRAHSRCTLWCLVLRSPLRLPPEWKNQSRAFPTVARLVQKERRVSEQQPTGIAAGTARCFCLRYLLHVFTSPPAAHEIDICTPILQLRSLRHRAVKNNWHSGGEGWNRVKLSSHAAEEITSHGPWIFLPPVPGVDHETALWVQWGQAGPRARHRPV